MNNNSADKKLKPKFSPAKSFYNYRNNDFQRINSLLNDNLDQIKTLPDEMPMDDETYIKVMRNNQEISGNLNAKKFSDRNNNYGFIRHSSTPGISPIESARPKLMSPTSETYSDLVASNSKSPATNTPRKGVSLAVSKSQFSTIANPSKMQPSSFHPIKSARSQKDMATSPDHFSGSHGPPQTARSIYDMTNQEIQDLEKQLRAKNKLQIDRAKIMSQHNLRKDSKRDISHLSENHMKNSMNPSIQHLPEINHRPIPSLHDDLLNSPRPMSLDPVKTEPDSRVSIEKNYPFHTPRIKKNIHDLIHGDTVSLSWNGEPLKKTSSLFYSSKKLNQESSILFNPHNTVGSFALNSPTSNDISHKKIISVALDKPGPFQNNISMTNGSIEGFTVNFLQKSPLLFAKKSENKNIEKDGLEDILNDLKRELPNIITEAPASRQDVIVLTSWIDSKIQQTADDLNMKEEEKNAMCDKYYTVCLNEIFRQINLECTERADLLFRIWTSYFKLFDQSRTKTDAENKTLKTLYQEENQKQYEWYQRLINKRDEELEECKLEIQRLMKERDEADHKLEKFMQRDLKFKENRHQVKGVVAKLNKQIEELKEENARYAKRLAYKIANTNKGTYVPTFLTHNTAIQGKEPNREASIPSNLGVGSSISTPLKNSQAGSSPREEHHYDQFLKVVEEENLAAASSLESLQSSLDFIYEDTETQAKQVFRIDQLNNNAVVYKRNITMGPDAENNDEIRVIGIETAEKETQTNLALTESKYDEIFEGQKVLEELISEVRLKKEVDILAENNLFASLDFSKIFESPDFREPHTLKRLSTGTATKSGLEDKIDGIGKSPNSNRVIDFKKHATEPRRRRRSSLGSELSASPNHAASPKMEEFYQLMKKILDSEVFHSQQDMSPSPNRQRRKSNSTTEEHQHQHKTATLSVEKKEPNVIRLTTPSANNKNPTLLLWAEPISEQLELNEDGKSVTRSEVRLDPDQEKDNSIVLADNTRDNFLKSSNTVGDDRATSSARSQDLLTPSNREIISEENKQLEEQLEEQQGEQQEEQHEEQQEEPKDDNPIPDQVNSSSTTLAKRESLNHRDRRESSNRGGGDHSESYEIDDLFHNLNDAASDYGSVSKFDAGDSSPPVKIKLNYATSMEVSHGEDDLGTKGTPGNLFSFEQLEGKQISFSGLASTKNKMRKMASMLSAKKEDFGSVVDKARLIMVLRMYKVEKEKAKDLQSSISELEEQLITEKQHQVKLQEQSEEMKDHIKLLEQLKAKCPHGRCAVCRGEKEADDFAGEKPGTDLSIEGSPKALYKVREENEDEEDGVVEDEDGETEEMDLPESDTQEIDSITGSLLDIDRGIKRQKSQISNGGRHQKAPKKKATVGIEPQLGPKKGKEKISAAFAIIAKVQDKKLAKFKNFMPMKAVLKQIYSLYNERINQMKETTTWREEEFCVFTYKIFLTTFGFRKIAEQKFIIFLLSIKKYLYVVRINLFARFMGLIQGPSNYTNDEFNKYLECVDFINSSTLGTTIVNNDTDSKHYMPFLRGLEYVRHFSENKMTTEEYVEFKRDFENIKENDPKNINRNGILDVDLFMTKVLAKYRVICSRTKQFVVNAFKAADLDGNKYCSLKEFIMIYRNIEHDKFDEGLAENIFNENADIKIEGEVNLSFDKFTVVCVEYGLFSDIQQDMFLGIHTLAGLDEEMESLKNNWVMHHLDIDTKLSEASKISREEKSYWRSILKVLNEKITDFQQIDPNNYKPLLIAWKILEQEVERLKDNEIERDLYGVKKLSIPPSNSHTEIKKS